MKQQATKAVNWRQWLRTPQCVPVAATDTLDMLAEVLTDQDWPTDHQAAMHHFLKIARDEGLVTAQEYMRLRAAIAPEM